MKLYAIAEQYQNIADILANPEFHDNPDVIAALDAVQGDFNDKAINTVKAIKIVKSDIKLLESEIKRLQAMKKVRQNQLDEVENYLKENMAKTGTFKIECPLFKISYSERQNSAVELDEALFLANNLDENLINVKITPNKTEIKKALNAGVNVIGAKLVDSQVLMIR